ncbi:hypothetical protein Y032_0503g2640 [Ancylostoma ceylanicum]|uniref:adenylate cyclase n=1 Tax=Ancylostoma ceylanicum TaxID=53326 RepID=A0A016WTY0_9BILA|nr:hypothetical protein Y032_0503g2640 [Ancylostoma ceylanicum]
MPAYAARFGVRNPILFRCSRQYDKSRLLAAFLPQHLISAARLQIATNNPHIYAEHYPQVTVAYGRLIGFEAVLSQCSSLDAARVLKEVEQRIDRLCDLNGCTKVASEGITVISSIPSHDPYHALNVVRFALQLEALVESFRDATTADVAVCVGIDSGSVSAGVVGSTKWHYDVIGVTVDNAILLQSNAPAHGVFLTEETRQLVEGHYTLEHIGEIWRVSGGSPGPELFPVNKRFSMVTVPQGINRLLQTLTTIDPQIKTMGATKKRKAKLQDEDDQKKDPSSSKGSFMNSLSLQFKNNRLETEFHKEMDHWFIPALAISIFFLVVYGIYHMLVMPRLITSLALIVVALTLMFFILLMLYINYFHSFSQFITRTSHGHSLTILLIMAILFLCGIVNTFSCPQPEQADVCQTVHFSAFSFAMWMLTTAVFIRFSSVYLLGVLTFAIFIYTIQIFLTHPPIGPQEFTVEFDLWVGLSSLAALVFLHARRCEKLMRLDFLSVVKVNETPWTIGELLHTLAQFLLQATQFASEKDFQVQIGMDCGSALSLVADTDQPRYELWGETVERARILMQSASQGKTFVSEEIFLALRPRNLHFSTKPMKVLPNLNAYILYSTEDNTPNESMPREEQERHTQCMFEAAQNVDSQLTSSMASSFSSELQSIDGGGETDSDIEWITPETALMRQSTSSHQPREPVIPLRSNYRMSDYNPYREPYRAQDVMAQRFSDSYKGDHVSQYSDWSEQESRAPSRGSQRARRRWRGGSKSSLRHPFSWMKRVFHKAQVLMSKICKRSVTYALSMDTIQVRRAYDSAKIGTCVWQQCCWRCEGRGGVEESSSKDRFLLLNSQVLLNLVPPHVAPWVVAKTGEQWHHAHHSVGVAYMTVSGFNLAGEQGLNGLNYVFTSFDQQLTNFRGIEKIKSANRFYIVAVGLLPDAAQNVNETPWTIGELLHTLAQFLLQATQFASEKDFQVQIGMDCGSALSLVADTDQPRYELWGETVERARILMQSASQGKTFVSEEIFLALRPRNLHFSTKPMKVLPNLNAYILYSTEDNTPNESMPREEQERHTQCMFEAAQNVDSQLTSSMASSFSSELQSIDGGGETDSDIEWITPETALMRQSTSSHQPREPVIPLRSNYRMSDYNPYREPYRAQDVMAQRFSDSYKGDHVSQYSDWSEQESRAPSRGSQRARRRWRGGSKSSLRHPFSWMKRGTSTDYDESLADPAERLEAAANRVDRMLQELNAYGDFADVKPLEYRPFPTAAYGSMKSVHRAMSSACHTEYDNAESEAALSDVEPNANGRTSRSHEKRRKRRWRSQKGEDADTESQCSSAASSVDLDPLRWKSVHSIGYENEYEMQSDNEGLAIEEMKALSRDIRKNFGDFKLATFDDIDQD